MNFAALQQAFRAQERAAFMVTARNAFVTVTGITDGGRPWILPRTLDGWPLGLSRYARGVREIDRDRRRHG